jgi:hypothetical protein
VTEVRVYFEGDDSLRRGFREFFREIRDRARERRCRIEFIATGGTPDRDFGIAIKIHPDAWNVLLRDSEGRDLAKLSSSLCKRTGCDADSIFWMVEMMESWFHADRMRFSRTTGRVSSLTR